MVQNVYMKKCVYLGLILLFLAQCSFAAEKDIFFDVKSGDFSDFGKYVETFETENKKDNDLSEIKNSDENFEAEAIKDLVKRYEKNAVELNLDEVNDEAIGDINSTRLLKLKVNEDKYLIEQNIQTENMIWDGSQNFYNAYFGNPRHMAPIPSVVNSSTVTAKVSNNLSATIGQKFLYDANGPDVLFVRANESTYNTGNVISYKDDVFTLSVASFSSSYNNAASGGAILSSNSLVLPKNAGSFILGGAYFANEFDDNSKSTGGIFGEYKYKRLKLNAQFAESKYTNSPVYFSSVYFVPELQVSKSLFLKTRLIRNITQESMQDEVILSYKPIKSKRNLEIEINASNHYTENSVIKQRIRLTTSFRI